MWQANKRLSKYPSRSADGSRKSTSDPSEGTVCKPLMNQPTECLLHTPHWDHLSITVLYDPKDMNVKVEPHCTLHRDNKPLTSLPPGQPVKLCKIVYYQLRDTTWQVVTHYISLVAQGIRDWLLPLWHIHINPKAPPFPLLSFSFFFYRLPT